MADHQLTFVGQLDGREIDCSFGDPRTAIAPLEVSRTALPDAERLLRGVPILIRLAQAQAGVHFGLIGAAGDVAAHGVMHCSSTQVETAVIGRHSHADTRGIVDDFALRHALLVRPKHFDESLRIFDLSGAGGTTTLGGEAIDGAIVDLPCVLRLGSYLLVAFKGEHRALGAAGIIDLSSAGLVRANVASATAARFLFTMDDLSPSSRDASAAQRMHLNLEFPPTREVNMTNVSAIDPRPASRQIVFRPDREGLARGFLLGRYGRCAAPGTIEWDDKMSRVHALLFAVGDDVYIADLGSSNGTRHAVLGELRLKHIENGDELWLGDTRVVVQACG